MNVNVTPLLLPFLLFVCESSEVQSNSQNENSSREKRWSYTPYQTAIGITVALAVPVDNGQGNVFLAYCIGTGPGQPNFDAVPSFDPPLFQTIHGGRKVDDSRLPAANLVINSNNDTVDLENNATSYSQANVKKSKRQTRNSFLTRRKFFRLFQDKLFQHGFNAKHCLLKAICETAQSQYGDRNGVLGDIINVLFSPTTSKDENLPKKYYSAEENGHLGLCELKYGKLCPVGVFDFISLIK